MYLLLDLKAETCFTGTAYPRISAGIPHLVSASSEIPYQFAKQALWVLSPVVGTDNWEWRVRQSTTDYQWSGRCRSRRQSKEVCSDSAGLCQIALHKCHRARAPSRGGGGCSLLQLRRANWAKLVTSLFLSQQPLRTLQDWVRGQCVSCSAGEGTQACSDGWQQCKSA